jgi:hypothetical protein
MVRPPRGAGRNLAGAVYGLVTVSARGAVMSGKEKKMNVRRALFFNIYLLFFFSPKLAFFKKKIEKKKQNPFLAP